LPQSPTIVVVVTVTVVIVVVVVVATAAHGSEALDSQVVVPRKTPSMPAHSLGVVSSQISAPVGEPPPTGGWQQANFDTCAGHPWASASHTLARPLAHALTPLPAVHLLAAVTAHLVRP